MNEKAKPIEEGCLAIVLSFPTDSCRIGKTVEVVSKGSPFVPEKNYWCVDMDGEVVYILEHRLLRIDDDDNQKQIESEKELCS